MKVCLKAQPLSGCIEAIPSKSDAQRAILLASLATGESQIELASLSQDSQACLDCIQQLGCQVQLLSHGYRMIPQAQPMKDEFTVGESATCLRLLLPILACHNQGQVCRIIRQGSLIKRHNEPFRELFTKAGLTWEEKGDSIYLTGRLTAGHYELPGNVSSQFISGLLIALASLDQPSRLDITTHLESAAYVKMTLASQRAFGQEVTYDSDQRCFEIKGGGYQACHYKVEGDWSNALYWLLAGVQVTGLNPHSVQADRQALTYLEDLGWQSQNSGQTYQLLAAPSRFRPYLQIDASQLPDAVPLLALAACLQPGESQIIKAHRLRLKESDRLSSTVKLLKACGQRIQATDSGLIIEGGQPLSGGQIDGANDHRIVMTAAIAATFAQDPLIINDAQAVAKSYPHFFEDYALLGGSYNVL